MSISLQAAEPMAELPGGYGAALLQGLISLAAVCLLIWIVLRWASQRGLGGASRGGRLRVLERLPLDPRRALLLVRVGERVLLIGTGDGAAPAVLKELDAEELEREAAVERRSFAKILGRLGPRLEPKASEEISDADPS